MRCIFRIACVIACSSSALALSAQNQKTAAVKPDESFSFLATRQKLADTLTIIRSTHNATRQPGSVQRQHVQRVGMALPWRTMLQPSCLQQRDRYLLEQSPASWPTLADAAALRALLLDDDAGIRALAAEALATLHQPEDVLRLVKLVNDSASATQELVAPAVGQISYPGDVIEPGPEGATKYFWRKTSVGDHVAHALAWMLGECCPREVFDRQLYAFYDEGPQDSRTAEFSAATLASLDRMTTGDPLDHLWYWEEHIHRSLHAVEEAVAAREQKLRPQDPVEVFPPIRRAASSYETVRKAKQEWMRSFFAEMLSWPAERRAMVRLLASDAHQGGTDMAFGKPQNLMLFGPLELGLEKVRVLDLLEGTRVWPDERRNGRGTNQVVERLAMAWKECFTREDLPHLMSRFRSHSDVDCSARAAILVALANLMPATGTASDDPNTAEGFLRNTLQCDEDATLRAHAATELMQMGSETHWPLVKLRFFAEQERSGAVRTRVLRWFGNAPKGNAVTAKLVELLTAEEYRPLWLESVQYGKGGGTALRAGHYARRAAEAVNARWNRLIITEEDLNGLIDTQQGPARLQVLLTLVRDLDSR